jgi:putative hemolysin
MAETFTQCDSLSADMPSIVKDKTMRLNAMALATASALLLTACSEPRLQGPACISAPMFKSFPVTLSESFSAGVSSGNAPAFDALVDAGLLAKSDKTYSLTESGRTAYTEQAPGFCYSQGYEIAKIKDVSPNPDPMGAAVDKSWVVTLDIRQMPVAAWAKTPALAELTRHPENLSEAPKTYHVTVGRVKGEQGLQLIDPRFFIMRGVSVSQGF